MSKLVEDPSFGLVEGRLDESTGMLFNQFNLARLELVERGGFGQDGFEGLSNEELLVLGLQILRSNSVWEAYRLMSQSPADSQGNYYDRLIAPQHQRLLSFLPEIMKKHEGLSKKSRGLDVGAGTGESSLILAGQCRQIVMVDMMPELLEIAKEKLKQQKPETKVEALQISALSIAGQFENSFDIVMDHGLWPYLAFEELSNYLQQLSQVLKPGGRYYSIFFKRTDDGYSVYDASNRAGLAAAVVNALLIHSMRDKNSIFSGSRTIDFYANGFSKTEFEEINYQKIEAGVVVVAQK